MGDPPAAAPPLRIKVDTPKPLDFVNASTQWVEWLRRFRRFKNISGLAGQENSVQIDTFLYILGPESEDVYEQLVFDNDDERTLDMVIAAFTQYFQPRSNVLHYRTQFYNRKQTGSETAEEYIRSIHSLASKCRFTENLTKDDMVKDRLLSGMSDTTLSSELQLDEAVTLDVVTAKMRSKETIENQMKTEAKVEVVKSHGRYTKKSPSTDNARGGHPNQSGARGSTSNSNQATNSKRICKYCGGTHPPRACPAYGKSCNICSKPNHYAKVCQQASRTVAEVAEVVEDTNSPTTTNDRPDEFYIHADDVVISAIEDNNSSSRPTGFLVECFTIDELVQNEWLMDFGVNGFKLRAKVDTGAQTNVISSCELKRVSPQSSIRPSHTKLTAYSGHTIPVLGVAEITLKHAQREHILSFHVLGEDLKARTLIGLPTINQLGLINAVSVVSKVNAAAQPENNTGKHMLNEFSDVFTGFGKLNTVHKIRLKPNTIPAVCPPRSVPHALRDKLKAELERLISLDIIVECHEPGEWLNPIVPVLKPNGSVRICLDPQRLNEATIRERYSLPKIGDIYARLAGSTVYTTLDAQSGFHQIAIDDESSKLTTFLTPFGRFRYKRLPFGITSAPEFFHKTIYDIVGDLTGVEIYIDDILIHAPTQEGHDNKLREVLTRFRKAGLKLNSSKCHFSQKSVKFLGNVISKDGIEPSPDKVQAILTAKRPTNKSEVRSLLGLVTYLARFCPRLSEVNKPLRDLTKESVDFCWEGAQEQSFSKIKDLVVNAPVLALFDPNKEVTVNVDASKHSLGAVLLQEGKPVEYAAQSLTPTQCMYGQVEKEMLAIQFGLTHFHQYVYGREVLVETDHQSLVRISKKPLNECTPRLQRMKMRIQHYQYTVKHVPGKKMYLSDYLSRFSKATPINLNLSLDDPMPQVCEIVLRGKNAVDAYLDATSLDDSLQIISQYTKSDWPKQKKLCHPLAKPYWQFRDTISEHNGLLFYGERLIIPHTKQSEILERLHDSHQGITKTQQRARTAVFWPGMCQRIEDRISSCSICKLHDKAQPHTPLIPSEIPDYPWQIIGSDLFQIKDQHYLLNVDYYSKWVNVSPLDNLSSKAVIQEFKKQFADFGLVSKIRSDNGPQYASREFKEFTNQLNIEHITSSPGFPRSNGQVERAIQTVKLLMVKAVEDDKCFWHSLHMLRNTPLEGNSLSPAQLLQGRNLYDGVPAQKHTLFPRAYNRELVRDKIIARQGNMKSNHDAKSVVRERPVLTVGQPVRFLSLNGKWEQAIVVNQHSQDRSYIIKNVATGMSIRRNRQQLREDFTQPALVSRVTPPQKSFNYLRPETAVSPPVPETPDTPMSSPSTSNNAPENIRSAGNSSLPENRVVTHSPSPSLSPSQNSTTTLHTRSGRTVRKPLRFRTEL